MNLAGMTFSEFKQLRCAMFLLLSIEGLLIDDCDMN